MQKGRHLVAFFVVLSVAEHFAWNGNPLPMKPLLLLGCLLLGLMQYRLWWGDNSLAEYFHLEHQIAEQQQNNDELDARNQALKEEILDLRSGKEAIEERARNELGFIKKGETFYRVVGGEQRSMTVSNN